MSRVDLDVLISRIKGHSFEAFFKEVQKMEKYTLLQPPYEEEGVRYYALRAQKELSIKIPNDYYLFMKCCDGGLLFTNDLYSIYNPDDEDGDLTARNLYLREEFYLPTDGFAIGETNYGAFIVLNTDGTDTVRLWKPDEEGKPELARFSSMTEWMTDVVNEAKYLLQDGSLPEIFDREENDDE